MRMLKGLLCAVALLSVLAVTGCNTVRGVGTDIEKGGEAIQRGASK